MTSGVVVESEQEHSRAARVAARSEILDVRMFKSSADLANIPAGQSDLAWDLEVRPTAEYSAGDDYFIVRISYGIQVTEQDESAEHADEPTQVASISFDFGALYKLDNEGLDSPIDPAEVDSFARTSSMFSFYPYRCLGCTTRFYK